MSYSKTDICNMALAHIGEEEIRSLEENNKRARLSSRLYEVTMNSLVSRHDWSFARKIATLQQVEDHGLDLPEGVYVYALPGDCKTPRFLYPFTHRYPWEVFGIYLVCKLPSVNLVYTSREIVSAMFTDSFVDLVAVSLASKLAPSFNMEMADGLVQQALIMTMEVWESDSNIGESYRDYDDDPNNDTFVHPDVRVDDDAFPGTPAQ